MKFQCNNLTELSIIRKALLYAVEQVRTCDIPVFENYETIERDYSDTIIGRTIDNDAFWANKDAATMALKLADELGKLGAEGNEW